MSVPLENRDALPGGQSHHGPLGVGALPEGLLLTVALTLPRAVERVDVDHVDAEDGFDGVADLDLVGVGRDDEGVNALVEQCVRLLRYDRPADHLAGITHHRSPRLRR